MDLGCHVSGACIIFVSSGTHDPKQKSGLPEPRYESAKAVAHHRPSTSGRRLALLATGAQEAATGKYFSDGHEARSWDLSYDSAKALDLWSADDKTWQRTCEHGRGGGAVAAAPAGSPTSGPSRRRSSG